MSPTALAVGDSAAKEPTQEEYAIARKPGPNDSRGRFYGPHGNKSILKEGYKELVISPGKLGLTLQFINDTKGATICKINSLCNFKNEIKVNDRVVSIDGLVLTNSSQLQIGIGHTRIFGIERDVVPGRGRKNINSLKRKDDKDILNEFDKKRKHNEQQLVEKESSTQKKKSKYNIDVSKEKLLGIGFDPKDDTYTQEKNPKVTIANDQSIGGSGDATTQLNDIGKAKEQAKTTVTNNQLNGAAAHLDKADRLTDAPQQMPARQWQYPPPAQQPQQPSMHTQWQQAQQAYQHALATQTAVLQTMAAHEQNERDKAEFNKWHSEWLQYQQQLNQYYATRHADGWSQKYTELCKYKQQNNGEANNVPLHYRDPNDLSLGQWVEQQRQLYWEGKLDSERVNSLKQQGFDFEYEPLKLTGNTNWDNKFRELIEYKKQHLNMNVPQSYPDGYETLGQWVYNQRQQYNDGSLDIDRHQLLESKGFIFEPGTNVTSTIIHEAWNRNYKELVQFKRDHGHVEVPEHYKATPLSAFLDKFIGKQRSLYNKKELSSKHIKLLEDVGLDLSVRKRKIPNYNSDENWEKSYAALVAWRYV